MGIRKWKITFPLVFSLRQTHHNTYSKRKINIKVFLYIINQIQLSLCFKTEVIIFYRSISKPHILILSREGKGFQVGHHWDPRAQSWLVLIRHLPPCSTSTSFQSCLPCNSRGLRMPNDACPISEKIKEKNEAVSAALTI